VINPPSGSTSTYSKKRALLKTQTLWKRILIYAQAMRENVKKTALFAKTLYDVFNLFCIVTVTISRCG